MAIQAGVMMANQAIINNEDFTSWWQQCLDTILTQTIKDKYTYQFGEDLVEVNFFQENNQYYNKAISHLEEKHSYKIDFTVYVCDGKHNSITLPSWFTANHYDTITNNHYVASPDSNYVLHYQHNLGHIQLQIINKLDNQAIIWFSAKESLPEWETSFPLRQILYHYFENSKYCMIHGAGVGINGNGVLLTAKGGSGKSTIALSCLRSNWEYIGDDFILLDTQTNIMYSIYSVAKLEPHQLSHFKDLNYERKENQTITQKQQLFLYPTYKSQLVNKLNLKAIVVPQYDKLAKNSVITPSTPIHALLHMAPSTVFLLKSNQKTFNKLSMICKLNHCYKFITSSDVANLPKLLKELL